MTNVSRPVITLADESSPAPTLQLDDGGREPTRLSERGLVPLSKVLFAYMTSNRHTASYAFLDSCLRTRRQPFVVISRPKVFGLCHNRSAVESDGTGST